MRERGGHWKGALPTAVLFTAAKRWKQPTCTSVDGWINKMCIHKMEYYLAIKRNGILIHAMMWMNLENVMLNKISQYKRVNIA